MKTVIPPSSGKALKEIHLETLEWKSCLQFIKGEIQFINQLLNSYVFEPNTLNLFERLQEYKEQITTTEEEIKSIDQSIRKHESLLGEILEFNFVSNDHSYYQEHELIKITFNQFYKDYRQLKASIFGYTGNILKKKKK